MLVVFTVARNLLERSLGYLCCPDDLGELNLDIPKIDRISEGQFSCTRCSRTYPVVNGLPLFSRREDYDWAEVDQRSIVEIIAADLGDLDLTKRRIVSLASLFFEKFGDRKAAIDEMFAVVGEVRKKAGDEVINSCLTQAATEARYDLEVYRGTFQASDPLLRFLKETYSGRGLIVEGACATGECLVQLANSFQDQFCIGLDLSANLARIAQSRASRVLFIQGDICSLPLKSFSVGMYVLNNVFDRVADPRKACLEAKRILNQSGIWELCNCDPLQYEYKPQGGETVVFVPEKRRLSLDQGLATAGLELIRREKGLWKVETIAYGKESLPYQSLVGRRK